MTNIRISPAVLLSLLLALCGSVLAQEPFTDHFEGSTINPFWTIMDSTGAGSVNLDTTFAHSGKRSVQVNTGPSGGIEALSHTFPSPLYGTVSVWVYYSNVTGTGYRQLAMFAGPDATGVDYYVYLDWGNLQTYLVDSSGATTLLVPEQSTGWHLWTFSSTAKRVTFKIDKVVVFNRKDGFAFETINLQQCCLQGSSFFDDFSFRSH